MRHFEGAGDIPMRFMAARNDRNVSRSCPGGYVLAVAGSVTHKYLVVTGIAVIGHDDMIRLAGLAVVNGAMLPALGQSRSAAEIIRHHKRWFVQNESNLLGCAAPFADVDGLIG